MSQHRRYKRVSVMQIRGRDETCQMSEKSFFFTRKSTRAMNGSLLLAAPPPRVNSFVGPPGSNGTSTRSCSPSPSPPSSRARANRALLGFVREIQQRRRERNLIHGAATLAPASSASPRRRRRGTPSRTPRAPPAHTPRPRRPPAAGTRPRRARAPRLGGGVVIRVARVDAPRRAG